MSRDHYVPQFYQKNFALDADSEDRRRIATFVIASGTFVPSGPINRQGYENNYYEKEMDVALKDLEGKTSPIIKQAIVNNELPERFSPGHATLLRFVLFQSSRTPSAAQALQTEYNVVAKSVAVEVLAEQAPEHLDSLSFMGFKLDNPVAEALKFAWLSLPVVSDLRWKLLVNRTGCPFISSDHPAVVYNQLLERRGKPSSGLALPGLQFFMPLGPNHMLVMFDEAAYRVGGRRFRTPLVEVTSPKDVFALNVLQAANAEEILLFGRGVERNDVEKIVRKAKPFRGCLLSSQSQRLPARHGTVEYYEMLDPGLCTRLDVRCITVGPKVDGRPLAPFRDERCMMMMHEFGQRVLAGQLNWGQLPDFMRKWQKSGAEG